ncbi:MAG: hypothetical protein ACFFE8_13270 [Candidatus Heimdallarchaeota archaeon]
MPFDDKLSRLCLKLYPDWPPPPVVEHQTDPIVFHPDDDEREWLTYTPQEWLDYKLSIPNDGRQRVYTHPEVEYKLTKQELEFVEDSSLNTLCNPVLCPNYFKRATSYLTSDYEVSYRFVWLGLQMLWVQYGFPKLPINALLQDDFLLFMFEPLIFKPFITYWGTPPDDFWIKLSEIMEGENHHTLHRGFDLFFSSQGRIFPPPILYEEIMDPEPESLYLPKAFWNYVET